MRTMTVVLLVLSVAAGSVLAQTEGTAADRARRVAPFVEDSENVLHRVFRVDACGDAAIVGVEVHAKGVGGEV